MAAASSPLRLTEEERWARLAIATLSGGFGMVAFLACFGLVFHYCFYWLGDLVHLGEVLSWVDRLVPEPRLKLTLDPLWIDKIKWGLGILLGLYAFISGARGGWQMEREVWQGEDDLRKIEPVLRKLTAEAEDQQRLIEMTREQAEAIHRFIQGDRQAERRQQRREQWRFLLISLVASVPIGIIINLLTG